MLAAVLAAIALPFVPTAGFRFVRWDDHLHVFENPLVLRPGSESWIAHLTTPGLGYPTPITILTYRLEAAVFGLDHPGAFHVANVALHLVACALAFGLARRIGLGLAGAALGTLALGLHPACAEPVSWISGRKDLLALALGLGSMTLALPHRDGRDPLPRRAASVALFALALLSKPVVAYMVAMVVALRVVAAPAGARPGARALARVAAPYAALVALVAPVALLGERSLGAVHARPPWQYIREVWYALGFHLRLVALLEEPTAKYLPRTMAFDPRVDLVPVAFAAVAFGLVRWLPSARRPVALLGLAWAVGAYLPSSNLLPLTRYLADSYVYGSMLGVGWVLGACFDHWVAGAGRHARALAAGVPLVAAALLGMLTVASSGRFRNSLTLWSHVAERYPDDYRVCRNLALAWYDVATAREALRGVDRCIARFGPEHFEMNRAEALYLLGRLDESEWWFRRVEVRRRASGASADPRVGHYLGRIASRRSAAPSGPTFPRALEPGGPAP